MRIVELRASNFATLRAVAIRPDGALVPIVGKNGAGKTTVLKAIWTALVGRAAAPPKPIREGTEKAIIKLDLGKIAITRTFSRGKAGEITSGLTITDEEGGKVARTPQALIDALLGDLSFDPLQFAKLKADEQFERLKALVPGVDFAKLARERQEFYDDRTIANRRAKDAQARGAGIALPPGPEPEAVDVQALLKEHARLLDANGNRLAYVQAVTELRASASRMRDEAEELRNRAHKLEQQAEVNERNAEEDEKKIPPYADTTKIAAQLAQAQIVTQARAAFAKFREYTEEAAVALAESEELTAHIADIDDTVRQAIAKAKLPAGLSLDTEGRQVLLGGLPFASAGTAEKIVASAHAAMALNPQLRVMLIDEGSELDSAHMEMLAELAEAHDYQIWVARVDESGGPGFRIEDGSVATK